MTQYGGARLGAGRRVGSVNKRSLARIERATLRPPPAKDDQDGQDDDRD